VSKSVFMTPNLSAIAEKSSILYCGRALIAVLADSPAMVVTGWRERLAEAVAKSDRSLRSISLKAGMGAGYLHGVLVEQKDPTIGNLAKIADQIGVSLSHIIYGIELGADEERLLRLYARMTQRQKNAFLEMAHSSASDESGIEAPPNPEGP